MKSILSATVFLLPALGVLTGCSREADQAAPRAQQNIEDAKRRNEDLKELERLREESARSQAIIEADRRSEELREARLQSKIERRTFNGKWVADALTVDGMEVPAVTLKDAPWYWIVDDETILSKRSGSGGKTTNEEEIRVSIDPSKSPKTIDLNHQEKKETNKGIYEFDGDTLKICFAMNPDGERPADFTAGVESKRVIMVWKRVTE